MLSITKKKLYKSFKRDKVKKGQKGQKSQNGQNFKMLEIVRNMCKINISSENVSKGTFIIYVPGGAAYLGADAEKSCRDLGGAVRNPVDV